MGVDRTTEVFNIPTRSIELPAVAQIRNEATKQNATTPTSAPVDRIPRASCQAPRKIAIKARR